MINVTGDRNPVQLTDNGTDDIHPAWLPDGETVVYASNRDGNYELYTINIQNVLNGRDDTSERLTFNNEEQSIRRFIRRIGAKRDEKNTPKA